MEEESLEGTGLDVAPVGCVVGSVELPLSVPS
jgi:hypothetical protein